MKEQKIPVLLDTGALMLELTNEQVGVKWLENDPIANPNVIKFIEENSREFEKANMVH